MAGAKKKQQQEEEESATMSSQSEKQASARREVIVLSAASCKTEHNIQHINKKHKKFNFFFMTYFLASRSQEEMIQSTAERYLLLSCCLAITRNNAHLSLSAGRSTLNLLEST